MPFVTAQELLDAKKSGKFHPYGVKIDSVEDAQQYLQNTLTDALENAQGKGANRPWHLVDLTKALDQNQAWVGFEYETGFDDKKEYQSFINFLWSLDHAAIDKEGTGKFPVEVAFAPQNMNEVLAGRSTLQQTLEFVHDAGLTSALNPTTYTRRDVGIHAGLSTPAFRKYEGDKYTLAKRLTEVLGRRCDDYYGDGNGKSKYEPTAKQMDELYGRSKLYWGSAHIKADYIELKMFKSIPDVERIKGFIQVVARIAKLVDFMIENPNVKAISNSYAYLSGADENPVPVLK